MADQLSPIQQHVLDTVATYIASNGFPPTVREIAADVGRSPSTVLLHLRTLQSTGRIAREGRRPRAMRLSI